MAGWWRGYCCEPGPSHPGGPVCGAGAREWRQGGGEMNCRLPMRYLAALWLFLIAVPGLAETPRWEFSLEKGGLQSFDRQATAVWMKQQGVLFLTPEWVLVYQVNRTARQAELGQRGASGGAGNFFLSLKVLSAQDGRVIKSMNLPTSASLSHVLATRGGSFLV